MFLTNSKEDADKAEDFLTALTSLMAACGVDALKMSDYGIQREEFPAMVASARAMGGLFGADPAQLSDAQLLKIYEESYR